MNRNHILLAAAVLVVVSLSAAAGEESAGGTEASATVPVTIFNRPANVSANNSSSGAAVVPD